MLNFSHFKTLAIVVFVSMTISNGTLAETTVNGAPLGSTLQAADQRAVAIQRKIQCAFNEGGAASTVQQERSAYMSEHLAKLFGQLYPELSGTEIRHIVAQGLAETDAGRLVEEETSQYASSTSEYKGRGLCQTTLEDNYAKLAGCEKVISQFPFPAQIPVDEFAQAPKLTSSDIVSDPQIVARESDDRSKMLASIGCVCYFMEQRARHPQLAEYLLRTDTKAVNEVGVTLNRGPGALDSGKTPLGSEKRQDLFQKAGKCFNDPV